ncbi:helix-turn-helix transcriptional regulator [Actinomadura kijaniata]|uniref:helix-turn-helix transcriptional regulator n=1 Tax=Actinomadura kijaniata TaxID=46161 RepID=UPI0024808C07|nr:helix-turn-helix transcriptional regulator [Actinomadura kijaniata]
MSAHGMGPVLVGRAIELAELTRALDAAPGAVLVGGEAGLGKTRLIREFRSVVECDRNGRMLVGGCLELGSDGLPFAPFTTVLRGLVRDIGLDGVAALLPRGDTGGLARLLPEFGDPDTQAASAEERARMFELVLTLLERLAESGPMALVIEDAHWADRSTRDLLSFLIRNVGSAPLLIVVTYRADELHRSHPLRPMLAELGRVERVRRMDVSRLARHDVAALCAGILGHEPDHDLLDRVYARSEGNPLFVEALLDSDGTLACELPESLRDLLLAGVQRLPEETQDALRDASGGGTRIEHRLLSAVTGLDDAGLTRVLRPAVAANVLVVDGDGYAFRHALIREALHDDLLPGEHTRLHTRYAQALENDAGLVPPGRLWIELSHHWNAAHDATWALVSAWKAAADTRKAAAHAESLAMKQRVLQLWDRVPDAAERIGADHVEVLREAVRAAELAGEFEQGIKLVTAALREVGAGPENAAVRADLLAHRGRMSFDLARPGFIEDLRTAVALLPAEPPTRARADALITLARFGRLIHGTEEAREAARESLRIARALGDRIVEAHALHALACVDFNYSFDYSTGGMAGEGGVWLGRTRDIAEESGNQELQLQVAVTRSHFYEGAGQHELAIAVARAGLEQAFENGVGRTRGSILASNQAEPLVSLGRWDEARAVLRKAMEQAPPMSIRTSLFVLSGEVAVGRGDLAEAESWLRSAREVTWRKTQDLFAALRLEAALRIEQGRFADAVAAAGPVLECPELPDDARYAWPVLTLATMACAELRGTGLRGTAPAAPAVLDDRPALPLLAERVAALSVQGPLQEAWRLTYSAAAAAADGVLERSAWDLAGTAWRDIGQRYNLAVTLLWAALAAIHDGDRDTAGVRLREADDLARELGARLLLERVADLTRRARLGGPARPGDANGASLGLTPRELEVLRLVADGQSNRDIAKALFISAKTASVHVSNILGKLGVASRGEAAATAHRLGLFREPVG